MLNGFVRTSDGSVESANSAEELRRAWSDERTAVWVDVESPTNEEMRAVGELFGLDAEALEDCLQGDQRPRIDEFDGYMFLVLYGVFGVDEPPEFDPRKLAAFCGARMLVTVHREPLRTVRRVRERCGKLGRQVLGRGTDSVIYSIIDGIVDNFGVLESRFEARVERLEEASLRTEVDEELLSQLHDARRDLLELARLTRSQRELLAPVAAGEYDYISESLQFRFAHVRDHLTHVSELLEGQRELLNAARDNYHYALANRMNTTMRTLTVFATVMLPATLIAGVYGMNVRLWPTPEHPAAFWFVLATMAVAAGGLLLFFRWRKWI